MAQVSPRQDSGSFLDDDLERLLSVWASVPELPAEWPEWDENTRLDLIHQRPITREQFQRVSDASTAGLLTEHQDRKWLKLSRLVAANRAAMEEMLGERP